MSKFWMIFPWFCVHPITPQTTTTTLTWKVSLPAKISTWPSGHSAYTAPVGSRIESRDPLCVSGRWQPDNRTWHIDRGQVGSHTCSDETERSIYIAYIHVRDINLNAVMKAKIHIKGAIEIPEVLFRNFRGSWGCTFYIWQNFASGVGIPATGESFCTSNLLHGKISLHPPSWKSQ